MTTPATSVRARLASDVSALRIGVSLLCLSKPVLIEACAYRSRLGSTVIQILSI
jgi:hypothetical protein